ncbi:hypothetical protein KCP73_09945 [Salmonella enterica subsp. enterica]|nr:hypothetical protein KCP73_09945 [Salmonella enterica subsp. enterica]
MRMIKIDELMLVILSPPAPISLLSSANVLAVLKVERQPADRKRRITHSVLRNEMIEAFIHAVPGVSARVLSAASCSVNLL